MGIHRHIHNHCHHHATIVLLVNIKIIIMVIPPWHKSSLVGPWKVASPLLVSLQLLYATAQCCTIYYIVHKVALWYTLFFQWNMQFPMVWFYVLNYCTALNVVTKPYSTHWCTIPKGRYANGRLYQIVQHNTIPNDKLDTMGHAGFSMPPFNKCTHW